MFSKERKLQIILEWIDKHPGQRRKVTADLQKLSGAYGYTTQMIRTLGVSQRSSNKLLKTSKELYGEQKAALVRGVSPALKFYDEVLKRHTEQYKPLANRMSQFGSSLNRLGFRLGWFGFRMVIMGRIMSRSMMKPIQGSLKSMKEWSKTMSNMGMTMGMMMATGIGSAEALERIRATMMGLPEAGMQVNAGMGEMQAIMAGIGVETAPIVASAFSQLAETVMKVWDAVGPQLIPVLQDLVDNVLPGLLETVEKVAPSMAIGFVEGIGAAIPIIQGLLTAVMPIIPSVTKLMGTVTALSPVLMAVGMSMYMMSTAINVVGTSMTSIGGIIRLVTGFGMKFGTMLIPIGPILAAIGLVVLTVTLHWKALAAAWNNLVAPAMKGLSTAVGNLLGELGMSIDIMGLLKAVTTPIKAVLIGLMAAFNLVARSITAIINIITTLIRKIKDMSKGFEGIGKIVKKVFGGSIHDEIAYSVKHSEASFKKLAKAAGGADVALNMSAGGRGGGATTMYTSVSIGNVSGIADLEMVYDSVNRAIGESYRRRRVKWG